MPGMPRTNIEGFTHAWNPVTGCHNGCRGCWAKRLHDRWGKSFKPMLHKDRLDQPRRTRTPRRVFVCPQGDLFGVWLISPELKQGPVLAAAREAPRHTYFFLTRAVSNYRNFSRSDYPPKTWLGATVTGVHDGSRPYRLQEAARSLGLPYWLSMEPFDAGTFDPGWVRGAGWVILGGRTGPGAHGLDQGLVDDVIRACRQRNIPLYVKKNARANGPKEVPDV